MLRGEVSVLCTFWTVQWIFLPPLKKITSLWSAEKQRVGFHSYFLVRHFPFDFCRWSGGMSPEMLSFLGDPKGNPKKLNISGRSPPQNQQKSNGKCQTRKCELETKQSFEADKSGVILWRRRWNYAFLANNAEIHKSPKTHFFIEKMLEILLRCRMANVWK